MPIPTSSKQATPPSPGQGPRRVVVIGTTGSGKTTVARQLAQRLGLVHVEIDALHWQAGWQETPHEVLRQRVQQATQGPAWVVDGNYSQLRDILWPRADTVAWLDYAFARVIGQLFRRTLRRTLGREVLWNQNRERFWVQFLSRDSLFLYACQTHWRRRRQYGQLFQQPEQAHLAVVRLHSPRATRQWLDSLG